MEALNIDSTASSTDLEELRRPAERRGAFRPAHAAGGVLALLLIAWCGVSLTGTSSAKAAALPSGTQDITQLVDTTGGTCGVAPQVDGTSVDSLIRDNDAGGILIVANPRMRCTAAAISALTSKGLKYVLKEFETPFAYVPGASEVWDWLHCTYPNDANPDGTIMHSYVFGGQEFQGNGFVAAQKIESGALAGTQGSVSCDKRFPHEAEIISHYQKNATTKVLLFGWLACPCMSIAQTRFAAADVCYEGRTWADPGAKIMSYLQCKERGPEDHSFVYFRDAQGAWKFAGNGFEFDNNAMPAAKFTSLVTTSKAATTCHHPNVRVNVLGTQLEECRTNPADMMGSWQDDGTCSEQIGGIHEICIEHLPGDFSAETHQTPWSEKRANQRHCVCVGAWSLYMTDAAKHPENAASIMPHCKAIPETALTSRYLKNWKDWNGYPANIVAGVGKLAERCLSQLSESDLKLKCGLKKRFDTLVTEVPELKNSAALTNVQTQFSQVTCP
jgi:hypothetical protein